MGIIGGMRIPVLFSMPFCRTILFAVGDNACPIPAGPVTIQQTFMIPAAGPNVSALTHNAFTTTGLANQRRRIEADIEYRVYTGGAVGSELITCIRVHGTIAD